MTDYKTCFRVAFDFLADSLAAMENVDIASDDACFAYWERAAYGLLIAAGKAGNSALGDALLTAAYGEIQRLFKARRGDK